MSAEESIVQIYARANDPMRINIIFEHFDNFISLVDMFEEDLHCVLKEEKRVNKRDERGDTGVRVQASNISNTTERIGLLLAGGFVERRNREIFREVMEDKDGQSYLCWKLDVVETAMNERMDSMERAVFKRLFVKHMTYKQIREACKKEKLFDRSINDRRKSALLMIEREIRLREGAFEDGKMYTDRLMQECRERE